jgi:CHRD domain
MRTLRMPAAALLLTALAVGSTAAQGKSFKARLAPVPMDLTMAATVAGNGSITASLSGSKLTITGTFDGLRSAATIAQLHRSPVMGVRGPNIADLTVSKATSGTISGTVDLTPAQLADLEKRQVYVQLHSEKAPDGNLWGWLVPQENRR